MILGLLLGLGLCTVGCSDDDDDTLSPCPAEQGDVAGIWYYCEDCDAGERQSKVDLNAAGTITFSIPEQACDPNTGNPPPLISTGSWTFEDCSLAVVVDSAPQGGGEDCFVEEGSASVEIVSYNAGDGTLQLQVEGDNVLFARDLADVPCYCTN
jgi:hypothetical protein